jgi:predicted DNA-binding transcriptional regulator AlpA
MTEHRHTPTLIVLRYRDLLAAGIVRNRTTLQRWQSRDTDPFPQPIRLGENSVAWRQSDVEAWLERRAAAPRPPRSTLPPRPKRTKRTS